MISAYFSLGIVEASDEWTGWADAPESCLWTGSVSLVSVV